MPAALEMRVHGIGDHDAWSALGSAPLADVPGGPRSECRVSPDIAEAPPLADQLVAQFAQGRRISVVGAAGAVVALAAHG